jgi:hypothetical protein
MKTSTKTTPFKYLEARRVNLIGVYNESNIGLDINRKLQSIMGKKIRNKV